MFWLPETRKLTEHPPKAALFDSFSNASDHSSRHPSKKHQSKEKTELENVCILKCTRESQGFVCFVLSGEEKVF